MLIVHTEETVLAAKAVLIFCVCISSNISTAVLIEQTKTVLVAIGFVNEVVFTFDKKHRKNCECCPVSLLIVR